VFSVFEKFVVKMGGRRCSRLPQSFGRKNLFSIVWTWLDRIYPRRTIYDEDYTVSNLPENKL
tara:strand:- start:194 stop:379 length:186 start_codon:yes stop_codon:yes gene_type:complete